jgi:hypothetical protein
MGMQDRDYYQDEIYKRHGDRLKGRTVEVHSWPPKNWPAASSGWVSAVVRTLVICLAVYGALALVRDFRLGLKPWQSLDPEKVQWLMPYLSGK